MARKFGFLIIVMIISLVFQSAIFAWPVSSPFGWRRHPMTHQWEFHRGIDISISYGRLIGAVFDGKVVWAGPWGGYGNTVIVQHQKTIYTLYGHCSRIFVSRGQNVRAREAIAAVGSSGNSTGPHVHLEYWVNHKYVDPMLIWKRRN